jgi:hypothetical protein
MCSKECLVSIAAYNGVTHVVNINGCKFKSWLVWSLSFLINSLEGYTVELVTLQDFDFPLLSSSITFCAFPVAP